MNGDSVRKRDIRAGKIYTVVFADGGAFVTTIPYKILDRETVVIGDLNTITYSAHIVAHQNVANLPSAKFSAFLGWYLVDTDYSPGTGNVWQHAIHVETLTEFNRYLNADTGAVTVDWLIALGSDGKNFVRPADILTNYSSSGLGYTNSLLTFNVNIGHVYLPNIGLVTRNYVGNAVTLPASSIRYVGLNNVGGLIVDTAKTDNSIYQVTTGATGLLQVLSYLVSAKLKNGILIDDSPATSDNSTKAATTAFVRNAITSYAAPAGYGLGQYGNVSGAANCNLLVKSGWYSLQYGYTNGPQTLPYNQDDTYILKVDSDFMGVKQTFIAPYFDNSGTNTQLNTHSMTWERYIGSMAQWSAWTRVYNPTTVNGAPLALSIDFNTFNKEGNFYLNTSLTQNAPAPASHYLLEVRGTNTFIKQEATLFNPNQANHGQIYNRVSNDNGSTWSTWIMPTDSVNFLSSSLSSTQNGSVGSLRLRNTANSNYALMSYNETTDEIEISFNP
jgi:hypothetical protein